RDALAGAAEWIGRVERLGNDVSGLVATVGCLEVVPNASNVVPGSCTATLDVRHADDNVRIGAVTDLTDAARQVADRRGLTVECESRLDQAAVRMDDRLRARLQAA